MSKYQEGYSLINPNVLNKDGRTLKARKIQSVINDYLKNKTFSGLILDLGCSGGIILSNIQISNLQKIGVDIDIRALKNARFNQDINNIDFICADGMNLSFRENTIAISICNHVYEHLPDSTRLFQEIFRTLKFGGVCYCAAGNALSIMEGHYNLPFLSWLPKRTAHYYLQIAGKGKYNYEKHLPWWSFKKQIYMFKLYDYTVQIIKNPEYFVGNDMIKPGTVLTHIPKWFLKIIFPLIPTWILMLEKPLKE